MLIRNFRQIIHTKEAIKEEKKMKDSLICRAEIFAKCAHNSINHMRKYTNEPYWVHPERVAGIVSSYGGSEAMVAAAWLHDVVEDVFPENEYFGIQTIKFEFGSCIASLVTDLTDISKPQDGNREKRKEIDRMHTQSISEPAKLIKLADLIDNSLSIMKYDPGFAKVYLKEKDLLLPHLRCASEDLYNIAMKQVIDGLDRWCD